MIFINFILKIYFRFLRQANQVQSSVLFVICSNDVIAIIKTSDFRGIANFSILSIYQLEIHLSLKIKIAVAAKKETISKLLTSQFDWEV